MNQARLTSYALWVFALSFSLSNSLLAEEYLTEKEALKLAFPKADSFEMHRMIATKTQRAELAKKLGIRLPSRFFKYYRCKQDDTLIGRAIVDEAPGKYHPFDFLLAVDPSHKVLSVEILNYHEKYGFEVKQDSFKQQFKGHLPSDTKKLDREIRIIAGATISCRSLIDAVKRQLIYLDVMTEAKEDLRSSLEQQDSIQHQNVVPHTPTEADVIQRKRGRLLMGTFLEIRAFGHSEQTMDKALNLAFEEVDRIEQQLSTYKPHSEISQLNLLGAEKPVGLSREVFELLKRSKAITHRTNGAFDITVGPIVQLWRHSKGQAPDLKDIEQSSKCVGIHHLHLDDKTHTAWFDTSGVQVDLGAIGKGYAMDRAAEILKRQGINRAMLSFGGHILALDPPPGKKSWNILVQNPKQSGTFLKSLQVSNASVATTADNQRGYWVNGKRFSHIIHPETGYPIDGMSSVTVVTPSAEEGDALSTALFALGPNQQNVLSNFSVHSVTSVLK